MAKRKNIVVTLISLTLLLSCITSPAYSATKKVKVGIIYDIGGRGDGSVNDAVALGVDTAKVKFGLSNFDVRELVTSGSDFDRENRIEFLVKAKYDLVIGVGSSFDEAMTFMSDKYPRAQFAIVGSSGVGTLNVSCMAFAKDQSAFLAGVMAAMNSKSRKIGYLGDATSPTNDLELANFRAGAKYGSSKIKVLAREVNDSAESQVATLSKRAVDVIFAPWSRNGSIVTSISKLTRGKKSIKLIGVKPEQFILQTKAAKRILIGYITERYENAVVDLIGATVGDKSIIEIVDGKRGVFGRKYTLANDGIDLVATAANQALKVAVAEAKAAILAKEIKLIK